MADKGTAGECGLAAGGSGAGGEGQSGDEKNRFNITEEDVEYGRFTYCRKWI